MTRVYIDCIVRLLIVFQMMRMLLGAICKTSIKCRLDSALLSYKQVCLSSNVLQERQLNSVSRILPGCAQPSASNTTQLSQQWSRFILCLGIFALHKKTAQVLHSLSLHLSQLPQRQSICNRFHLWLTTAALTSSRSQ